MRISFFGASVTQQKYGYVYHFQKELNNSNNQYFIHGYGSMHIVDAGICFIKDIVKENPEICFLDWFSTSFLSNKKYGHSHLKTCLHTILYELNKVNCLPIFLLFDSIEQTEEIYNQRLEMYEFLKSFAFEKNIPVISLYNLKEKNINIKELLRDNVHTNDEGSKYYGINIKNDFLKILENKNYFNFIGKREFMKTIYHDIKSISQEITFFTEIKLRGNGYIMGIYQKIGPFSPIVNITSRNIETTNKKTYQIWDKWAYYERETIKLRDLNILGELKIEITDLEIDHSESKIQLNWNDYEKKIIICRIFYLGDLIIENWK